MAQLYLMECILHTFPDEWHAATLETLLLHTTQLQPGNLRANATQAPQLRTPHQATAIARTATRPLHAHTAPKQPAGARLCVARASAGLALPAPRTDTRTPPPPPPPPGRRAGVDVKSILVQLMGRLAAHAAEAAAAPAAAAAAPAPEPTSADADTGAPGGAVDGTVGVSLAAPSADSDAFGLLSRYCAQLVHTQGAALELHDALGLQRALLGLGLSAYPGRADLVDQVRPVLCAVFGLFGDFLSFHLA